MKKAMLLMTAVILTALLALNAYAGLTIVDQGTDFDSISASEIFGKKDSDTEAQQTTDTNAQTDTKAESDEVSDTGSADETTTESSPVSTEEAQSDTEEAESTASTTANTDKDTHSTDSIDTDTVSKESNGCKASITGLSAIAAITAFAALVIKKDNE